MKNTLIFLALFVAFTAKAQTIDTAYHAHVTCKISAIVPSRLDTAHATRIGINTAAIDFGANTVTVNYTFYDSNGIAFPDYDSGYFTAKFASYGALLAYLKNGQAFVFTPLGAYLKLTYQ